MSGTFRSCPPVLVIITYGISDCVTYTGSPVLVTFPCIRGQQLYQIAQVVLQYWWLSGGQQLYQTTQVVLLYWLSGVSNSRQLYQRVHKLFSSDGDYQGSVIMSGTQVVLHYWWLSGVSDHVRYTSCTPVSVTIRLTSVIMLGTHAVLKCWWLSGVSHHVWHMYAKLCQCVSQQLKALSTEPKSTITLPDHSPPRRRCESNVFGLGGLKLARSVAMSYQRNQLSIWGDCTCAAWRKW